MIGGLRGNGTQMIMFGNPFWSPSPRELRSPYWFQECPKHPNIRFMCWFLGILSKITKAKWWYRSNKDTREQVGSIQSPVNKRGGRWTELMHIRKYSTVGQGKRSCGCHMCLTLGRLGSKRSVLFFSLWKKMSKLISRKRRDQSCDQAPQRHAHIKVMIPQSWPTESNPVFKCMLIYPSHAPNINPSFFCDSTLPPLSSLTF